MKKFPLLAVDGALLAATVVEAPAQTATYYNNYVYNSYINQMVRDHMNQRCWRTVSARGGAALAKFAAPTEAAIARCEHGAIVV